MFVRASVRLVALVVVAGAACLPPIAVDDAGAAPVDAGTTCDELVATTFSQLATSNEGFDACDTAPGTCTLQAATLECDGRSIESCPVAVATQSVDAYTACLVARTNDFCDDAFDECGSAASTCQPMYTRCVDGRCATRSTPYLTLCGAGSPCSFTQGANCPAFVPPDGEACTQSGMCWYCTNNTFQLVVSSCLTSGAWVSSATACEVGGFDDAGPARTDAGAASDSDAGTTIDAGATTQDDAGPDVDSGPEDGGT